MFPCATRGKKSGKTMEIINTILSINFYKLLF